MCESTVLLKGDEGLSTVMAGAVRVAVDGRGCVCTDVIGRSASLDGVRVAEIDLLRNRIILERA